MKWPLPRSLAAQLACLLVLAVLVAQIPPSLMFAHGVTPLHDAAYKKRIGDRAVFLDRVLRVVPADAVPSILASFDDIDYRFSIDPRSAIPDTPMSKDERGYSEFLARRFGHDEGPVRAFLGLRDPREPKADVLPNVLKVSVRLRDGRWLNGETYFVAETPFWLRNTLAHLAASMAAILAVIVLGLRRIVEPVTALAQVAERAGRGEAVEALPERGPRELQTMTASFNLMHERLHAYIEDRARMMAAVSHDLRTPIASLRLRAEMVDDDELREAMVRTLDEMRQMADAVLSLARQEATEQQSTTLDIAEMARAIVDDHRALGGDVTVKAPASLLFHGRAQVLRRAIDNLVDNALRYGGCARLSLADGKTSLAIRVDDKGPGVPADRIEEMFMPFARLEGSRSADTGGAGLGLAIVRSSIRMHGGDVTLANLPGGGLRAEITLPKGAAPVAKPVRPALLEASMS